MICSELTTFAVESPTYKTCPIVRTCCDLLRINYLCGRITNKSDVVGNLRLVVICSELTTFAVESPTFIHSFGTNACCDLLRINYLCGRITNPQNLRLSKVAVVICSELTTFAVESPTSEIINKSIDSCDLLRINYLCGRITNPLRSCFGVANVVICSELTTFAVESPTSIGRRNFWYML